MSGKVPPKAFKKRTFFPNQQKTKHGVSNVFLLENFSGSIQDLVLEAETFRKKVSRGWMLMVSPMDAFFSEEIKGLITRIFLTKRKQAVGGSWDFYQFH